MKCKNCKTKLEQGVIGFRKVYPNHYEVGLVDDELEYIEIEDLVDDGVYYCTNCYKDLSLSDDEVIEILKRPVGYILQPRQDDNNLWLEKVTIKTMREKIEEVIKDIGFDFQDHSKSDISYLFQMLRRAGIINFNVYRARGFHDNSGKWFRFQVEWYSKKIEHAIILDHIEYAIILDHDMSNHIEDIEDILGIIKHYNEKIKEIEKIEEKLSKIKLKLS